MARNGALIAADQYKEAYAITLGDTEYTPPFDAFMVGADGDVSITDMRGTTTVIKGLLAGHIYPIAVSKFATSDDTTATDLVGLRF